MNDARSRGATMSEKREQIRRELAEVARRIDGALAFRAMGLTWGEYEERVLRGLEARRDELVESL
jgi:hypothetical protein